MIINLMWKSWDGCWQLFFLSAGDYGVTGGSVLVPFSVSRRVVTHQANDFGSSHMNFNSGRSRPTQTLTCPFCFKKYSTWNSLKKHKSVYHRDKSWDARRYQRCLEQEIGSPWFLGWFIIIKLDVSVASRSLCFR